MCLCGVLWKGPADSHQEGHHPLHPRQDWEEGQAQQNLLRIPRDEEVRSTQFTQLPVLVIFDFTWSVICLSPFYVLVGFWCAQMWWHEESTSQMSIGCCSMIHRVVPGSIYRWQTIKCLIPVSTQFKCIQPLIPYSCIHSISHRGTSCSKV